MMNNKSIFSLYPKFIDESDASPFPQQSYTHKWISFSTHVSIKSNPSYLELP